MENNLSENVLPAGSIVKINGIPFETKEPVTLLGAEGNYALATVELKQDANTELTESVTE